MFRRSYPVMVSYAQQSEDVILRRLFAGCTEGFYVDVGAGHPVEHSVTKFFYDHGWRGINIEPQADLCDRLAGARPRDVNLAVAAGAEPGEVVLSTFTSNWGWATTDPQTAKSYGISRSELVVQQVTLDSVLTRYNPVRVDFLKIDVEGAEGDVLAGLDLQRWQPTALVIEATKPNSPEYHAPWEVVVLEAGYTRTMFDGLNNYYVRANDPLAFDLTSVPCNVFDNALPSAWWESLSRQGQLELIASHRRAGRDVSLVLGAIDL